VFVVAFAASVNAAGLFSATGSDFFSFMLVGVTLLGVTLVLATG
jgi:hypothetical protein